MVKYHITLDQPIYLSPDNIRRSKPRWNTVISVIDGSRNNEDFSYSQNITIALQWIYEDNTTTTH